MVPGIGVECVCLSGAVLAKAGTILDVGLVGGNRLRSRGMCEDPSVMSQQDDELRSTTYAD